jgi:hypothetical protein
MNFEQFVTMVANLPMTWYPAILNCLLSTIVRKKIFKDNGLLVYCKRIIAEAEAELATAEKEEKRILICKS